MWETLHATLKKSFDGFDIDAAPLGAVEIEEVATIFGCPVPDDLAYMYRTFGIGHGYASGSRDYDDEDPSEEIILFKHREMRETREQVREMESEYKNKDNMLLFGCNGLGVYFSCFKSRPGFFVVEDLYWDEREAVFVAPTLEVFFRMAQTGPLVDEY